MERVAARLLTRGPSVVDLGVADSGGTLARVTRGSASDDPLFDLGSVTKVVVTAALCTRLDLDAGSLVRRWFPRLGVDARVDDLLAHRAGLWEWWPLYLEGATRPQEAVEVAERLPPRYPPGDRHYSDLGFLLLGGILVREQDEPLDALAARHVLEPLGMASSGYRPSGPCVPTSLGDRHERRMVETGSPYPVTPTTPPDRFGRWRTHRLAGEANDGNCWHACGGVAGHAGLFSTVPDLLRFGQWLLHQVRRGEPVPGYWPTPGRLEHPGFPGTRFAVLPERDRVVVLLTNRLYGGGDPPSIDADWEALVAVVEAAGGGHR